MLVLTTRGAPDHRHLKTKSHPINNKMTDTVQTMVQPNWVHQHNMDIRNNPTIKAGVAVRLQEDTMEAHLQEGCTTSNNRQWGTMETNAATAVAMAVATAVATAVDRQVVGYALDCWERWRVAAVSIC